MRCLLPIVICACASPGAPAQTASTPPSPAATAPQSQPHKAESLQVAVPAAKRMQAEAEAMRAMIKTDLGRAFLDGAAALPSIEPRTIYREKASRQWFSAAGMQERLAADATLEFEPTRVDEERYYDTKYGTPIAYARLFDLLGKTGRHDFMGAKILDFGYGTIGHLRMLASSGADVTGLDVDSFLTALYSEPGDTGAIATPTGEEGHITLVDGRLSDARVLEQGGAAGGYDLIISKNTLKRGYIHPPADVQVDKRMLIDLGVDDATFLRTLFDALKPGGFVMIYNICPKQADYQGGGEQYIPWADGRCPFDAELMLKTGFRVCIHDRDDSVAVREMAHILGWDQGERGMDLQNDLFAHFTLLEKPAP